MLGAPFLEAGCLMRVASCTVHTPATPFDPHNTSYAPGQRAPWPHIRALDGSQVDLRVVPGPAANIHDHACLSDLDRGWVEVENPRLRLSFSLEWEGGLLGEAECVGRSERVALYAHRAAASFEMVRVTAIVE